MLQVQTMTQGDALKTKMILQAQQDTTQYSITIRSLKDKIVVVYPCLFKVYWRTRL